MTWERGRWDRVGLLETERAGRASQSPPAPSALHYTCTAVFLEACLSARKLRRVMPPANPNVSARAGVCLRRRSPALPCAARRCPAMLCHAMPLPSGVARPVSPAVVGAAVALCASRARAANGTPTREPLAQAWLQDGPSPETHPQYPVSTRGLVSCVCACGTHSTRHAPSACSRLAPRWPYCCC